MKKKLNLSGKKVVLKWPSLPASLEEIDANLSGIRDLAPLAELRDLRVLCLRGTQVASLEPVLACSKLEYIYAEKTRLTR